MNTFSENEDVSRLIASVNGALGSNPVPFDTLEQLVLNLAPLVSPNLDEEKLLFAIDYLQQIRIIDMEPGVIFASPAHEPWLDFRKRQISWLRWDAYRQLMSNKSLPPKVLDGMHTRTEKILDLAGDPHREGHWSRRGLVIGDVQSGKTANYLALFNKAADAGYRVFILLAGNTDKLRQQTQSRVDEGFIGRDTRKHQLGVLASEFGVANTTGIGEISNIRTNYFTTYNQDFSTVISNTGVHLDQDSAPTVFVIKKNKTILRNLTKWLQNSNPGQKIQGPVLLLDDEADYASINTNSAEAEATAINRGIRELLGVFEKNSYVGFTATPFANVLIDEENKDDLYPRNFIYALESPSNYFGPNQMFELDADGNNTFIENLVDGETAFPFKHSSNHVIADLPDTLKDAVRVFFITNAVRDLRDGQLTKPRSMLVNVSRYVRVQYQVFDLIQDFVSDLRDSLKYQKRNNSIEWMELEKAFESHFGNVPESWDEVAEVLIEAISDIVVHVVNSKNKSDSWESVFEGPRARVIAVGGDVLSRGLTLEGLSTSYFYRRSLAYDTLMQMGRWFGYRDGYRDLCRLWIDLEVSNWYKDISEAIEELRDDLAQMASSKLEPSQFGLAVRCHPGALMMVTARNKALASDRQPKRIHVRDISEETSRIASGSSISQNWNLLIHLVDVLKAKCGDPARSSATGRAVWLNVPQDIVGRFLSDYSAAESQTLFADKTMANFIQSNISDALRLWDVVLMSGSSETITQDLLGGLSLVERKVEIGSDGQTLYVGGSNQRLGGSADIGITFDEKAKLALAELKKSNTKQLAGYHYRSLLTRPILIIYPIKAKPEAAVNSTKSGHWLPYIPAADDSPLVGVSVSFPRDKDESTSETVLYQVNSVWKKLNKITLANVEDSSDYSELDEDLS